MPTLRDVAAACGVSPATVSKALNNAPDVGQETAQRIRQRAKELGLSLIHISEPTRPY